MKRYVIYLLKPEIREAYYRQEETLYQFFMLLESERKSKESGFVHTEEEALTKEMPIASLISELRLKPTEKSNKCAYRFDEEIALHLYKRRLIVEASSRIGAEWDVFSQLQQIDTCFFAYEEKSGKYGWLKPMKVQV
ncbi:sporulation inhibitor of replication protein SirA [Salsuginibacillus kocurii]|uniref:sporulation inhibitor of replication protein SirA n=1 Tax=Salsuginibacillus kocurii TaxID=427078 RepID=UPI0003628976|nr:sporulation inhibitor of replication protein SirA [Salsuginibacillus kocurii]